MSTLIIDTLQGKTSSTSTDINDLKYQLATSWVTFDGTAGSLTPIDSYNVASITDNGLGNYTITFSIAMSNADYSTQISVRDGASGGFQVGTLGATVPTTTAVNVLSVTPHTGSTDDSPYVNVTVHGGN